MTTENKISIEELEQMLLNAEEIIGTQCRYGIEFKTNSQDAHVSLKHGRDGQYMIDGSKNEVFSSYSGKSDDSSFNELFNRVKKAYDTKREEKKKREEIKIKKMMEEDSQKYLYNELSYSNPSDLSTKIYVGEIKNIQLNNPLEFNGAYFYIKGDVELHQYERVNFEILKPKIKTWWPPKIEIEKIPNYIDKEIWKISETYCSFYETGPMTLGRLWNGYPIETHPDEDKNFYITKIIEKGKENNTDITEELVRELFTPMFKELNFGDLCERYNGNKKT
ncbi:MAG: hypothetical protein WC758_01505 [Candidatus Woesearchaeota archaeon]|jgi:hypothetical protein